MKHSFYICIIGTEIYALALESQGGILLDSSVQRRRRIPIKRACETGWTSVKFPNRCIMPDLIQDTNGLHLDYGLMTS